MASSRLPTHVDPTALQAVISAEFGEIPPAPLRSKEGFLHKVTTWLIDWIDQFDEAALSKVDLCAFLLEPELQADAAREHFEWLIRFREDRTSQLGGRVYLANHDLRIVFGRDAKARDASELANTIRAAGKGSAPCVIFNPAQSAIIWCPNGVLDEFAKRFSLKRLSPIDLDPESLDAQLTAFHTEHTEYPDGFTRIWVDAKKHVTHKDSEADIRNWLFYFLRFRAYRSNLIIREAQTPAGRADIRIGLRDLRTLYFLELKVFRTSYWSRRAGREHKISDRKNYRWGRKGVYQAAKYKAAENATGAYVVCFDARKADTPMPQLKADAEAAGVVYKKYYMYNATQADLPA